MLNLPVIAKEYVLVSPGKFQLKKVKINHIPIDNTLISPVYTAICASDLQYYRGEKASYKLINRLPLVLLHEGICLDRMTNMLVVPVAGDSRSAPKDYLYNENLWPNIPYMGATSPGLARTYFSYPKKFTIPAPLSINPEVTSLTEPLSIVFKAIKDINISYTDKIAIIGTGGIAYLISLVLVFYYNYPANHLYVMGKDDGKLQLFSQFSNPVNYKKTNSISTLKGTIKICFEAVGRSYINETMSLAMQLVKPGGKIGVIGLSDINMSLPSNDLVNSGITIKGLTRSNIIDYHSALEFMQIPKIKHLLKNKLINSKIFFIKNTKDLKNAFEFAEKTDTIGRVLLKWPI